MAMILKRVERPRELKWYQVGAMLYGDWGTSKAYVLGIAFALSGHASWFMLGLMSVLTAVTGICYMIICRHFPDGGGVYSSVKTRSQILAVIGALLLVADYVVTAALSTLDAFHYLNVPNPEVWAIVSILVIGAMNWLGPSKGGTVAMVIAVFASLAAVILFCFAVPQISQVSLSLPTGGFFKNWSIFVGIVLALSGVESVANMTGIMVPPVKTTSSRAILPVLLEVSVLTFLLGIAMNAIPGLTNHTADMLRVLGDYYVAPWYGKLISVLFGFLLLSAANTAISGIVSIQFAMAKDRELPPAFLKLNRFGMPRLALVIAVLIPILVLLVDHDIVGLAALYAIGVVGAITLNLGVTATNFRISLKKWERVLLFSVSAVLLFAEITIAIEKHNALIFALSIVGTGLLLRHLTKVALPMPIPQVVPTANVLTISEAKEIAPLYKSSVLVALRALNMNLLDEAALRIKALGENALYLNYVEEIPQGAELSQEVEPSAESLELLAMAEQELEKRGLTVVPVWQIGDDPGKAIAHAAKELGVKMVMIGTTKRGSLMNLLRGEVLRKLASNLSQECRLVISG